MSIAIIGMGARIVCADDMGATCGIPVVPRHRYPESEEVADTVRALRDKLERYRHRRARQAGWVERFVPTGLTPVDAALPRGGLPCGAITEILSENPGVGAMSLAMRTFSRMVLNTLLGGLCLLT